MDPVGAALVSPPWIELAVVPLAYTGICLFMIVLNGSPSRFVLTFPLLCTFRSGPRAPLERGLASLA
jgi:hypothetical protein